MSTVYEELCAFLVGTIPRKMSLLATLPAGGSPLAVCVGGVWLHPLRLLHCCLSGPLVVVPFVMLWFMFVVVVVIVVVCLPLLPFRGLKKGEAIYEIIPSLVISPVVRARSPIE